MTEPDVPEVDCPCCHGRVSADELSVYGMFISQTEPRLLVRAYNGLTNAGIDNAGQVSRMTEREMWACKGISRKTVHNILQVIAALGLSDYREAWLQWDEEEFLKVHPEYVTTRSI